MYQLQQDTDKLQNGLKCGRYRLTFWSAKVRSNPNHVNSISGCDIVEERDLGVLIDNHLKSHGHLSTAIGQVRRLLELISKSFINLSPLTFPCLYKAIVRLCLEYRNII